MHDLSEGVIPSIFELIVTKLSTDYKLNPSSGRAYQADNKEIILKSFENFNFFEGQPSLKWVSNVFKISGTALQVCMIVGIVNHLTFDLFQNRKLKHC